MDRKQIRTVFIISLMIFLITGSVIVRLTVKIINDDRRFSYYSENLNTIHDAQIKLTSAIFFHSQYYNNRDYFFLKEYGKQKYNVLKNLEKLDSFKESNKQISDLDSLINLMREKISILDQLNTEIKSNPSNNIVITASTDLTEMIHDIDFLADNITGSLNQKLINLGRRSDNDSFLIITTIIAGYTICFLFMLFSFFRLKNEIISRNTKEKQIISQTNELKKLNKTKDTFFSIIAHDLKGPFTSLINLFDLLKLAIDEKDMGVIEENIAAVEFSARRTYNLLNNLLEWSRLQTGNITPIPEYFEIRPIVEDNFDLFNEAARQKEIDLIYTGIKNHVVYADRNMIGTVIRNLIQNAIKFTEKGHIKVNVIKSKEFISVQIEDTGIGISEENLKILFQIDHDPKLIGESKEKGTGLGLILCKSFMDINNGYIKCESQYGMGSTFTLMLPFKK